jgi:hypothetical protein
MIRVFTAATLSLGLALAASTPTHADVNVRLWFSTPQHVYGTWGDSRPGPKGYRHPGKAPYRYAPHPRTYRHAPVPRAWRYTQPRVRYYHLAPPPRHGWRGRMDNRRHGYKPHRAYPKTWRHSPSGHRYYR